MKLANQETRTRAITKALLFTISTILVLVLAVWFYFKTDNIVVVKADPCVEKKQRFASSIDSMLTELSADCIQGAIANDELGIDDHLLRLRIGREKSDFKDLIPAIKQTNLKVYWKESGQNLDYVILYLGRIDDSFIESYSSASEVEVFFKFSNRLSIEKFTKRDSDVLEHDRFLKRE